MTNQKRIVVIGSGPAGVQAAQAASSAGQRVILVSETMPGGRAAWQTLLPSKMWLAARNLGNYTSVDALRERYEQVAGAWQRQLLEDLERTGVELRLGTGSFLSPHEIQVTPPEGGYTDQLSADTVIVATGSVPFVPPGLQPDGVRVFSPHTVWKMPGLPESMVVIGAGGPATEYVDAFSRLGVHITWLTGPMNVLSSFPPDAGQLITRMMGQRGVRVVSGLMAREIRPVEVDGRSGVRVEVADGSMYEADLAFVAIGLRPDLTRLNLPAAGLKPGSSGGVATDPFGRTAVPHIYIVGDAASPLSANISIAQGRIAGWHAAGLEVEPLHTEQAVMAIYTDPQVAMVGRLSDRSGQLQKVRIPFSACLRSHLMTRESPGSENGFLELSYDGERRVAGALAVCPEAAEILTVLAVAIKAGMTIDALAAVYPAHPTFTELAILAARNAR